MSTSVTPGDQLAYTGPSTDGGPDSGKIGVLTALIPNSQGTNDFKVVFESDGMVFTAPASSWMEAADYKSSQTKKWIIAVSRVAAAAGGYWWWHRGN